MAEAPADGQQEVHGRGDYKAQCKEGEARAHSAGLCGKQTDREGYYKILSQVGLPEKAFEQRVKEFSKGMRQKVGIVIVIIRDAPAVILDEPTSGLDPQAGAEFISLLEELRGEGKAVFMSTHDIFRASTLADKIGIMKGGKLIMERTREELANEDLEKIYLDYMLRNERHGGRRKLEIVDHDPPMLGRLGRGGCHACEGRHPIPQHQVLRVCIGSPPTRG